MTAPNNDSRKLWVSMCEEWMMGWIDSLSRQKIILPDWTLTSFILEISEWDPSSTHTSSYTKLLAVLVVFSNPASQEKASALVHVILLCLINLFHPFSIFELFSVTFKKKLNYSTNTWANLSDLAQFQDGWFIWKRKQHCSWYLWPRHSTFI